MVISTRCGCLLCEMVRRKQRDLVALYAQEAWIRERIAKLLLTAMPAEQRVSLSRELESEKSQMWDRIRAAKVMVKAVIRQAVH